MRITAPFEWRHCPACGHALVPQSDGESQRPYCPDCERFYYSNPAPASCCIVPRGDDLLFVQRSVEPCRGEWTLPGGFVELGETTEEAAIRELLEETGLRGRGPELIGASTQPSASTGAVVVIAYLIEDWDGAPSAASDAMDARFFPPGRRPRLPFKSHRDLLDLYDLRRQA
jgi:ADP-ribose pyrophosphatase YjhB (NUDIX family)